MSKFWSGVENGAMVLFVFVIAYFLVMPGHGHRGPSVMAKKKSCVANMKTIEGALELYFMENKYQDGSAVGLNELKDKGYLKNKPMCPTQAGTFDYTISSHQALDGKVISEVECVIHGRVSLQATTDKNKGL